MYELPIHERILDQLAARPSTSRITLPFNDWERLVMMIGTSIATVKLEYGKLTWLTRYGEIVCVPGGPDILSARYEP